MLGDVSALQRALDYYLGQSEIPWTPAAQHPNNAEQQDDYNCGVYIVMHDIRRMSHMDVIAEFEELDVDIARYVFALAIAAQCEDTDVSVPAYFGRGINTSAKPSAAGNNAVAALVHQTKDSKRIMQEAQAQVSLYRRHGPTFRELQKAVAGLQPALVDAVERDQRVLSSAETFSDEQTDQGNRFNFPLLQIRNMARRVKREMNYRRKQMRSLDRLSNDLQVVEGELSNTVKGMEQIVAAGEDYSRCV